MAFFLVFSCFKESCPKDADTKVIQNDHKPFKTQRSTVIQKCKQDLRELPFVM
jgi:hypothetical protein